MAYKHILDEVTIGKLIKSIRMLTFLAKEKMSDKEWRELRHDHGMQYFTDLEEELQKEDILTKKGSKNQVGIIVNEEGEGTERNRLNNPAKLS